MCLDIIQVDNNISLKAVVFVGIYACIKCYGATSQLTRGGRQLGAGSPCEFVRGRLGRAGTLRLSSVRQSCELVATGAGTRTHQTWLYVQAEAEQLVMHLFLCLQRHAHMEGKRQDTPKLLAPTLFASRARSAYSAPTHRWNAWHKVGGQSELSYRGGSSKSSSITRRLRAKSMLRRRSRCIAGLLRFASMQLTLTQSTSA